MRQLLMICALVAVGTAVARSQGPAQSMTAGPRMSEDDPYTLKVAVIGDNGTGGSAQDDVARQMARFRWWFPFDMVLMLGDAVYGRQQPEDLVERFERPYAPLLDCFVKFYATMGSHDTPAIRNYQRFNMAGNRYYSFVRNGVRFLSLDTNLMDSKQIAWIDETLRRSNESWKVAFFHHPLYSDAVRHGPNADLRVVLEPLFVAHAVSVVFSGHDHVYERLTPQKGITYFVEGASGQLRHGDVRPSPATAAWYDRDQSFVLVEFGTDSLTFQAVSRTGEIVDSGVIHRTATARRSPRYGTR